MPYFSPKPSFYGQVITFLIDLELQGLFLAGITIMSFDPLLECILHLDLNL